MQRPARLKAVHHSANDPIVENDTGCKARSQRFEDAKRLRSVDCIPKMDYRRSCSPHVSAERDESITAPAIAGSATTATYSHVRGAERRYRGADGRGDAYRLRPDDAKEKLELLVDRGYAEIRPRKAGALAYVISYMLTDEMRTDLAPL